MLRIQTTAALLLVMGACQPDLPFTKPTPVVNAVFDPTTAKIPLPNDLAVPPFNDPNSVCPPDAVAPAGTIRKCAQAELLSSFTQGFPSDQEVAITIDFVQTNFDKGMATQVAPELDTSSFTPSTFFVIGAGPSGSGEVPIDPIMPADYAKFADHGTLTVHHAQRTPWPPGSYVVVMRGGPNGVKTTDQIPVSPSAVFDLVAQGLDMTDPKNLGLLKAQTGSTAAALAQGAQLNLLIGLYKTSVFPVADTRFPHQELAIATTFTIAPTVTNVSVDPARGLAPLPIDLLRDPTSGKLSALAACTLAGSSLAADGNCATAAATAAAAGFKTLDGFSTTGAILGPTSDLVLVSSVTKDSLLLYDLSTPAAPALVDPNTLIIEPCEFASACGSPTALSPVIAIQPAGATAVDPQGSLPSVFRTKPLKDNTDYAVVMNTDIHDKAGKSIGSGTVAKVLQFKNPVSVAGKSALVGIDDATAASLEKMRLQLVPVLAAVPDRTKVAMAYTFHTQTILSQANQLAALPYSPGVPAATALPIPPLTVDTPAAALTKFGGTGLQSGNINEILEVDIVTFNALDPATGAFLADPTKAVPEQIHVLIATPKASAAVPDCQGGLAAVAAKCAPMMVFRHGLGRGRLDMLAIADTYAGNGMVTVAIDAAKHGDRSFCTSGITGTTIDPVTGTAVGGCNPGVLCTTALPAGAQGDAQPPGTCGAGGFAKKGIRGAASPDGIPEISGNYLVSANFFRTRDTMRQDLIDESQLIRALALVPPEPAGTHNVVFEHMASQGLIIDPATIYYTGQSLGSIQGTMDVATNPRISKAVFNVGGGTIVDIFTNSPAFATGVDQLLAGLGIQRGTAQFLQFLVVAKTVLDPADPINFAGHLTSNTLPNLLAGGAPQAAKKVLTQIAHCDAVVPNPFGFLHSSNIPTGPLLGAPGFGGPGNFEIFTLNGAPDLQAGCSPSTAVEHGFLLNFLPPHVSLTTKAQDDAAAFVMKDALPPGVQN
jgi:hypothetical protein